MGSKIDKILFASDLTDNSRYAFQYASSLASRYNAALVLVHVIEDLHMGIGYRIDSVLGEGTADRLRAEQKVKVRDTLIGKRKDALQVREGLAKYYGDTEDDDLPLFEVVIVEGIVNDELLKVAKEKACDIIVIGSHKGLIGGTALSGITKSVLKHSSIPVLVVPPPDSKN